MRRLLQSLAVLALVAAAACAPRVSSPGDPVVTPAIDGDHLRMPDKTELPLRVWWPAAKPKAVVLALHGFNDYSKAFEAPGAFLAQQGILVYAYDQRSFGGTPDRGIWPGVKGLTGDLRTATRLIRDKHPGLPLILLGESMGGAVIMAALAEDTPPEADGVVLAAPAVWSRAVMPAWQARVLTVAAHTVPAMQLTGRGFGKVPSDNIEMLRALSRDKKVIKWTRVDAIYGLVNLMDAAFEAAPALNGKTLILFGTREDIIPKSAMAAFEQRLPRDGCGLRVAQYDTGFHMLLRDLKAERVLTDITAWMADAEAPLPSGAERAYALNPGPAAKSEGNGERHEGDGVGRALAVNCAAPKPSRARSSAG